MITIRESGLSADEYEQFKSLTGPYAYELEAFKWNPDFSLYAQSEHTITGDAWSAFQAGPYVFKMSGNSQSGEDTVYLDRFDMQSGGWNTIAWDVPVLLNEPAKAHYDEYTGRLSIWERSPYGLHRKWSDDGGVTWASNNGGDWENICGDYLPSYRYNTTKIPSATIIYSGYLGVSYEPYRAFDNDTPTFVNGVATSDSFWAVNGSTGWIGQDFGTNKTITKYTIRARGASEFVDQNLKSWTLQYSDNGSSWTTAHTGTAASWQPAERRTYVAWSFAGGAAPSYGAHRYWRINITANQGNPVTSVGEIEMFDYSSEYDTEISDFVPMGWDKVMVAFKNRQKENYDFRLYAWNGSAWTTDANAIIGGYNYPISDFQGVQVNETDWYFTTSAETPGPVSVVSEHDGIGKYFLAQGGIVGWWYKNGQLSEHVEIDVLDKVSDWRYRQFPRINRFNNGKFYLTAYSSDGTEVLPFQAYRLYTSEDGKFWSAGNVINVPEGTPTNGLFLAEFGDYVYAFTRDAVYRSDKTILFGEPAPSTRVVLTDYVQDLEINQDGVLSVNFAVNNETGQFDDHAVLNTNNVVYFRTHIGFWVDDGAGGMKKLLVPVATTIMDTAVVDHGDGPPHPQYMFQVSSRDPLLRMTDLTTSETAHYWKSQILGLDTFEESIDSYYGGLSHTATQSGSHQTISGELQSIHSSLTEEVVSFSTYSAEIWNGVISVKFKLAEAGNRAGIVFHAADGDNYMVLLYNQSTDKLEMYRREGGFTLASNLLVGQSTLSWTGLGTWRHLRLKMDYGYLHAWTSSDGINWTLRIDKLAEELYFRDDSYTRQVSTSPFDRGFVGVYATNASSTVTFDDLRLYDNAPTQTVEDAIRATANFAGIHDFIFTNLMDEITAEDFDNSLPADLTISVEAYSGEYDDELTLYDMGYEYE